MQRASPDTHMGAENSFAFLSVNTKVRCVCRSFSEKKERGASVDSNNLQKSYSEKSIVKEQRDQFLRVRAAENRPESNPALGHVVLWIKHVAVIVDMVRQQAGQPKLVCMPRRSALIEKTNYHLTSGCGVKGTAALNVADVNSIKREDQKRALL